MKSSVAFALACLLGSACAFAPIHRNQAQRQTSNLSATSPVEAVRKMGLSFIAASTILSNVAIVPQEVYAFDAGSSQVIAARSGGRAGGRAPARAPARASAPTRVIERQTTIIQQPAYAGAGGGMMMAPQPMYAQPAGGSGLGLVLGLNAVSGIADGFREARQENEIRSTRDQLTEARIKEAEMEARLRQLEMNR
jgi:hypothetical protein